MSNSELANQVMNLRKDLTTLSQKFSEYSKLATIQLAKNESEIDSLLSEVELLKSTIIGLAIVLVLTFILLMLVLLGVL